VGQRREKCLNSNTENYIFRSVKMLTKLDKIKYEDIWKELNIYSVNGRINSYRKKWINHLKIIDSG
jgi:hypothetical protein